MSSSILVINCGSSSVKFGLFEMTNETLILSGLAENLGSESAQLIVRQQQEKQIIPLHKGDLNEALSYLLIQLWQHTTPEQLSGVGHRVVHGGEAFKCATPITSEVLDQIKACSSLAPLHNPANIMGIETLSALLPNTPQIAVFDTAFHQQMPARAFLYPLPMRLYRDHGVRRYGFHGTSHNYVYQEAARRLNKPLEQSNWISAHLGNGCSATAIRGGISIDTTMGMTPLDGLVMGTRSGEIDPGLFGYLADVAAMDINSITSMLNRESGLLGLSELSNDCRTLEEAATAGNEAAQRALDVFAYRLAKTIGALAMTLNGQLDGLIFTGGIGENSAPMRKRTMAQLGLLGFALDDTLNTQHGDENGIITKPESRIALVVPTNEELMIARDTHQLTQIN